MKAATIMVILEDLFPEVSIPLYHKDPFTLLIAVLLSAQCIDERVNQVTPHLFTKADTPEKMASLDVADIEQCIQSLGLFRQKAKAIAELSSILVEQHKGQVPKSFEALESLPGVGHKTASVIMAQAFHIPAFPVDTHIHRLAKRWGLTKGRNVLETEKDLKALFPKEKWHKLHLQMIYFGRTYCKAVGHNPKFCPICSLTSL